MRILHVTDCFLPQMGGIETQVSGLALHQAERGDDVAVFTTTLPASGRIGATRAHLGTPGSTVDIYRLARRMPGGIPVHPNSPRHAAALAARLRPDVIHVHMGGAAPSSQFSIRRLAVSAPTVLTVHSVWTRAVAATYRALSAVSRFPGWGVTLSAVSDLAAQPVRAATRLPVHVAGNGIDLAPWRATPLPHDGVHIVSATRFAPRKRVIPLLQILRSAAAMLGPDHRLTATIAGEGPGLEEAHAFLAEHGMTGWVRLAGRLNPAELSNLYRTADVYLAPVVLEAFSIAILEAQAAGLAIVCRSQSGAAERLTDGVDGLTRHDDEGLAHAVAQLALDDALLRTIRSHNAANPPPYAWADVLKRTDEIYWIAGA